MSRGIPPISRSPMPEIAAGAARYRKANGFLAPEQDYSRSLVTPSTTRAVGQAYMDAPDYNPAAEPAYRLMRDHTMRQLDHLTSPRSKGGMGLNVEVTHQDPYGWRGEKPDTENYSNYHWNTVMPEMRHDAEQHNKMLVYSTKATGGHPYFSDDENDAFRAVHDAFGHLATGRGIDRHGEEAAYQAHASMYPAAARGALAMELRGQNSALHLNNGVFQDQKVGIMPARFQAPVNLHSDWGGPVARRAAQVAQAKSREQGL